MRDERGAAPETEPEAEARLVAGGSGRSGFYRWGPYGMLALATALAGVTAEALMTTVDAVSAGVLAAGAVVLQLWWGRVVRRHPEREEEPGSRSVAYYALRTLVAGALSWLNPFFVVFAVVGLRRRAPAASDAQGPNASRAPSMWRQSRARLAVSACVPLVRHD